MLLTENEFDLDVRMQVLAGEESPTPERRTHHTCGAIPAARPVLTPVVAAAAGAAGSRRNASRARPAPAGARGAASALAERRPL